jgi:hypothetical protein
MMRFAAAVLILSASAPIAAQEWIEYVNREDRFIVNLPGRPTAREISYRPQRGAMRKGRVYTVDDGPRQYSVTVIDFAGAMPSDVRGSIAWEAWNIRKRGGDITYDAFAQVDRIDGHEMHITNADKTTTLAALYLHASRLYILQATVPPNSPGALHFQQSLVILDEEGKRIRYELDADGNRSFRIKDLTGIC